MKKNILLAIIILAINCSLSAINQDSVTMLLRKKAYERYHEVKDTVTVRTWMNMDRMNKALVQILEYDNQLLESMKKSEATDTGGYPKKLDTIVPQPVIVKMPVVQKSWMDIKYFPLAAIVISFLLLVLIVLVVKRSFRIKHLRQEYDDRDETFDAKLNRLEFLEGEVLKMKSRENDIKAELEKGIIHYQEKMQTLRNRIDELANENVRLENLIETLSGKKNAIVEGPLIRETDLSQQQNNGESEDLPKRIKKPRKQIGSS